MNTLAGINWSALFSGIPAAATAQAIALAWTPIVGGSPTVVNRGDYYQVVFTPEQEDRAAQWLVMQLNKEPGPVRVDMGGIAWKVIVREYWPYILGTLAAGAVVGYAARRRK
jgi:hypothetical protein